jgi:hypothetical protein
MNSTWKCKKDSALYDMYHNVGAKHKCDNIPFLDQVLQSTVMKQLEIAESLEEMIRSKIRVKINYFCFVYN